MAVPGPVTSAASAGCHELIGERGMPLVTAPLTFSPACAPDRIGLPCAGGL
jgi:hypothetical protein